MKPAIPDCESQRLAALYEYEILNTEPEADFDNLVRLAAHIFQVPISVISLIDRHHQWFKASLGLQTCQTIREVSFCAHTILDPEPLVVLDTWDDPRFFDHPFVLGEPHIRFYAGVPLMTPTGYALGALCVVDQVPREITSEQLEMLQALGQQVVNQLELRRNLIQLKKVDLERQQKEQDLQQKNEVLQAIFQHIPAMLVFFDGQGNVKFINHEWEKLLGWTVDELQQKDMLEKFYPDPVERERVWKFIYTASHEWQNFKTYTKNGTILETTWSNVRLSDGSIIGIGLDISARNQAAELLRVTQQRLQDLLGVSSIVVYSSQTDGDYGTTFISDNITSVFGYSPTDFIHNSSFWIAQIHPDDRGRILAELPKVFEQGHHAYEYRFRHQDGRYRWVYDEFKLVCNETGKNLEIAGTIQDITARKQAAEEIQQTRNFLQTIVDHLPVALFVKDGQSDKFGQFKLWNKTCETIFGLTAKQVIGKTDYDLFPPNQADFFRRKDQEAFRRGTPEDIPEEPIASYSLGTRILHTIKVPMYDESHNPEYLICISEDITDRKQAEEALKQNENQLQLITDSLPVLISYIDRDHYYRFVNQGYEKWFGLPQSEIQHKHIRELLGESVYQRILPELNLAFSGQPIFLENTLRKAGKDYDLMVNYVPHFAPDHQVLGVYALIQDVTERKQLERQFLRAQRMESIGTLAGGIAHDLNNVLAPILMSVSLLEMRLEDAKSRQWLNIIDSNTRRGASLVKQVLSYARGLEGDRLPLELHHLIWEIKQMVEETFPKSISLSTDISNDLWVVYGDPTQLHQILMNLCINARDAMPMGGLLHLAAENLYLDSQAARPYLEAKEGLYVVLTVTDQGIGIPKEHLDRIFEPFFTTKEAGKGTGLGLSTVMAIIRSHGGFITVESEVGKGTQFKVFLPAVATQSLTPVANLSVPQGQGQTVLVVDDEAAVREMLQTALETHNYQVITARDGAEAIQLYTQQSAAISLVLTDLMMPGVNGTVAIQVLQRINPQIKIILMSGLLPQENAYNAANRQWPLLMKPFTTPELLWMIHDQLNPSLNHLLDLPTYLESY